MEQFLNKALNELMLNTVSNVLKKQSAFEENGNKKDIVFKKQTLYSKMTNQLLIFEQKKDFNYTFIALSITKNKKEKQFDISFVSENRKPLLIEIQSLIIHPASNNQIGLVTREGIAFIKDLTTFTEMNNQIIIKHIFPQLSIIKAKFSYFEDNFGVLLSNNTFRIYSIDSPQYLVEISNFSFDSPVVDFTFCPYNRTNPYWESFLIYFIGEKGQLSVAGPFFPKEFKLNSIDFISMKHKLLYLNELSFQLYSALEKCIVPDPKKDSKDNMSYYFAINYQLDNWNKHLSSRPLGIQSNLSYDYNSDITDIIYKQIELISSDPYVFLFKVTEDDRIEVIALFETIVPIRDWHSLVNTNANGLNLQIKGNFLVEVIHLDNNYNVDTKEKAIRNSTPLKCLCVDKETVIIEENCNVYSILFPYISSMRTNHFGNQMTLFNSITKMIVKASDISLEKEEEKIKKQKDKLSIDLPLISKNYFLFELIGNEIVLSKLFDKKLVCKVLSTLIQPKRNEAKSLSIPLFKPQLSSIDYLDSLDKSDRKDLKKELELVNQFHYKTIAVDHTNKVLQKALRTSTLEGLINEQINAFAKHYESIFNTQFDLLQIQAKALNQEMDLIGKSNIKQSYDQCLQQINTISNEQKIIQSQNEDIKRLLVGINKKIFDIKCNSQQVIKSMAIINHFQKEKEEELRSMTSMTTSYDQQIKNISIENHQLGLEMNFDSDLISHETKEEVNSFLLHIQSIKNVVAQCLNELNNDKQ